MRAHGIAYGPFIALWKALPQPDTQFVQCAWFFVKILARLNKQFFQVESLGTLANA
jgi:hypothetical protein